jgi:hypothetical protein
MKQNKAWPRNQPLELIFIAEVVTMLPWLSSFLHADITHKDWELARPMQTYQFY